MAEVEKTEDVANEMGGIAVLPKTNDRPLAIVGMGGSGEKEQLKTLSERLGNLGMEHTILTLEEAEKEGITKEDLLSAQLEQKQIDGLTSAHPSFRDNGNGVRLKKGGGSKAQQRFKRKKKGKKTHRNKR